MDPATAGIIRGLSFFYRWTAWVEPSGNDEYTVFRKTNLGEVHNVGTATSLDRAVMAAKQMILDEEGAWSRA